ncbi:hypothetical protein Hypma_013976, partial [Hypsizygus marmoreus]
MQGWLENCRHPLILEMVSDSKRKILDPSLTPVLLWRSNGSTVDCVHYSPSVVERAIGRNSPS